MAVRHMLIAAPPARVWEVLADGDTYGSWVPGTRRTEEADPAWPAVGASLRYQVRLGRWSVQGSTVVRRCESGRRLELEAQAGRLGSARIAFELLEWGEECLVVLDEHPLRGPGARLHNPVLETFTQLRHRTLLRRLSAVVEGRTSPGPRAPAAQG
ncbi:SRPBCC family protein [Streptomyces sp. NPDC059740]|uniref:SRPBCC family protein n=1 Tax=Streptomyces sp. NPDC059740 TaxID=3346926 RepID=UPI00365B91E3